jgi:hypothetical protein
VFVMSNVCHSVENHMDGLITADRAFTACRPSKSMISSHAIVLKYQCFYNAIGNLSTSTHPMIPHPLCYP